MTYPCHCLLGDEYEIAYQSCCDDDEDLRSCDDVMVMGMMRHLTREVEYLVRVKERGHNGRFGNAGLT
jgi:hypothetical protein